MVKCKKAINQVAVVLPLVIFMLTGCRVVEDSAKAKSGIIGDRSKLKELSYNLIQLTLNGGSEQEVKALAKEINNLSELVIIGRVVSQSVTGQESPRSSLYSAYCVLKVESVKRGSYPYGEIRFLFGMYSTDWPVLLYPGYVKKKYRSGDRVKVYLNYFDEFGGYAAVAGFYSIQPYYLL